jgi:outer membrane protein assembly factor BamB
MLAIAACAGPQSAPPAGTAPEPSPPPPAAPPASSPAATAPQAALAPAATAPSWRPVLDPTLSLAAHRKLRSEVLAGRGELPPPFRPQEFPERYALADGVLTFRGGPRRDGGAFGDRRIERKALEVAWAYKTGASPPPWGGGAGWTGQPVIVRWPDAVRAAMPSLGARQADADLVEVIQGSLDGNVYFLDLRTGKPTRPPLRTGNPIKGSVSVDPRGWPLLFVGQGIPAKAPIGLRVYALTTMQEVFFLPGRDPLARRGWGAFDSSGLVNRDTDTFLVGGENGLVYLVELGARFDPEARTMAVAPRVLRYRFGAGGKLGIENSLAADGALAWFADNGGELQALDLRTLRPAWTLEVGDDTDASVVVEGTPEGPALYVASEVDLQGDAGKGRIRRLDGETGAVRWVREYRCKGGWDGPRRIQAGSFSTPLVGKDDLADRVVFSLCLCPEPGVVVALAKDDGRELWRLEVGADLWSTPTAVRDGAAGKTWILQADRAGRLMLVDGADGKVAARLRLDANVEASPAVFDDTIVLATRGGTIYGIRVR